MTAIGELVVKIVPDAKDFRRDTIREMEKAGIAAQAAYQDGSESVRKRRTAGRVGEAAALGKTEGDAHGKAFGAASEDGKERANKPNLVAAAARGTAEGKAQSAAFRKAFDVSSFNARMFRLQQEGLGLQAPLVVDDGSATRAGERAGSRFIDGVDVAVARGSGRVTKRTNSLFDGFFGGLAFNAPMFRGVASTFGLMGGQALYAGAAVSALGVAVKTLAVGAVGLGVGVAAFTALSVASLKTAGTYQMQAAAMNVLMDSTEKGGKMMKDLVNFSKTTPFELEGTIDAAKRLLAMGFAAEEVLPQLQRIGNATAALGTGTEGLSRLALVMGQIRSKGKLMTQDVNQLAEQGIPLWDILATKLGKTRGEIMTLTENGLVPAETALEALNEYMDMKFSGTLQAQAETLLGTFENLKESFKLGFAQRLQDDLPAIAGAMRDMFPAIEGFSTRIADALGPTLVSYLDAAVPAVESFLATMGDLATDLMDTWTPTMSTFSNNMADAFANARPGLQILSDAFAGVTTQISGALPGIAQQFSDLAFAIESVGAVLSTLKVPLMETSNEAKNAAAMFALLPDSARMIMDAFNLLPETILGVGVLFQSFVATALLGASQVAKAFGQDGLARDLSNAAEEATGKVAELEGRLARAKLTAEVRVQFEDMENQLALFGAGLDAIPKEVLVKAGIDTSRIRTGSASDLRRLLNLPDQVLIDAGINPADIAAMQTEASRLLAWIESQPAELQATINADASDVEAKIAAARTETEKDFWIKFQGNPEGVIAAAAQANAAVTDLQGQVVILDATTGTATLAADATPAELALAVTQGLVGNYDGTTGTATLLTRDEATATLQWLGLQVAEFDASTSTADLAADSSLAQQELGETTARLNAYELLTGTATLDADPVPATTHMDNASIALRLFGSSTGTATLDANKAPADAALNSSGLRLRLFNDTRSTATLDANSRAADSKTETSQSKVNQFGRSTSTAILSVDNSGVLGGVASALSAIGSFAGKTFTAVLSTVTGKASGGPIGLASGGQVPVAVSNGEFALYPETVRRIGMGNAMALNAGIPIKPGLIRGAGTGTSDSIRGTLPPGSFVIREQSVRRLSPGYLRSLASGGPVSSTAPAVRAGNSYNWTVYANNQPSEQAMLTHLRRADAIYGR